MLKWVGKGVLWLVLCVSFAIGGITGLRWAWNRQVLSHYDGYQPEKLKLERFESVTIGEDSTWYLLGSIGSERIRFQVSPDRQERLAGHEGEFYQVWWNPAVRDMAFQGDSIMVVFDTDWKPKRDIESKLQTSRLFCIGSLLLFLTSAVSLGRMHGSRAA